MPKVPAKADARIGSALKRFQPVLKSAKAKDVNESDTVMIITDMLSELFGYDKYSEITSEHSIKGTYCDLAITVESKVRLLIEAKAIGLDLKEAHTKQAIDYAANKGIDWVILTNGNLWQIYKVFFAKPISQGLVAQLDLLTLNPRSQTDRERLYMLTREGMQDQLLQSYYVQSQATSRFLLGQLVLTDAVLGVLRRELKRIYPEVRVQVNEIEDQLKQNVLKRDVVDTPEALAAKKLITKKSGKKAPRAKEKGEAVEAQVPVEAPTSVKGNE